MACGCGGNCCGQQPKGLGFLWWGGGESADEDIYGDYDYLYDYGGNYGGGGDFWGFDDPYWSGGGGGDYWGFSDPFWGDYWGFSDPYWGGDGYNPATNTFSFYDYDFLPANPTTGAGNGGDFWGFGDDFWTGLQNAISGALGGSNPPPLGYCPGGTYHPLNDPYACVPFPPETPEFEKQQRAAAAHKAAQDALKAAAKKQQQQQGCPPNTGLVKNAQGQCVCPPGYAANAQLKKCVLVNPALAAQSGQAPDWLKYALLALGAVVVVKAVKK